MGQVILSKCVVTTEKDWIPVVLDQDLEDLAVAKAILQEEQSKQRRLNDRAIDKNPALSLKHTTFSKRSEYAVHQYYGRQARVTEPGEFHDYPDVEQCNVRFICDINDSLMIQDRDQGDIPMILTTCKDMTFKDKTIWLIGWGMTDLLRRTFYLINQGRPFKDLWQLQNMQPHEQFVFPKTMLNPMKTLSKEFVNTPFKK